MKTETVTFRCMALLRECFALCEMRRGLVGTVPEDSEFSAAAGMVSRGGSCTAWRDCRWEPPQRRGVCQVLVPPSLIVAGAWRGIGLDRGKMWDEEFNNNHYYCFKSFTFKRD